MARGEAVKARADTRAWVSERRARTRHLIELGGLIQKAGLVDLTADDRSTILGALLEAADGLRASNGADRAEVWRRRGKALFAAEKGPEPC